MKRKLVAIMLGLTLAMGMTACGGGDADSGAFGAMEQSKESEQSEEEKEALREAAESWYYINKSEDGKNYYFANANEEVVALGDDKINGMYSSKDMVFHYNVISTSDTSYNDVLMDVTGKNITEPGAYDSISRANKALFMVEKEQAGVINYKGEVVVPLEFEDIEYYEEYARGYFIGEPTEGGQYVMYNDAGVELLKSEGQLSNSDIRIFESVTPGSEVFEYQQAIYSLQDGSKIADLTEGDKWYYNLLYKDGKVTAYDENLQISDELVVEDFHDFASYMVYDWRVEKDDKHYGLDENYKFVEVPQKAENTEHTLENGKKYKSRIDEVAKTLTICDESGSVLCTLSLADIYMPEYMVEYVDVCGNYLALMTEQGYYFIDMEKGEFLTEGVSYVETAVNGVVNVFYGEMEHAYHVYFNENFLLTTNKDCISEQGKQGFWVIDRGTGVATSYNLMGEVVEEVTGVTESWPLTDDYLMLILEGGKSKIISNADGKVVWEPEFTEEMVTGCFPHRFREDGVGVLELEDGFYDLKGNCILKK